ncbi:MAG: PTS sugar transporter subunit IIA [Pelolinea sp.]|nr:PTS sugar transporter subunit IIA [Pelolinea sp.]
MRLIDVLSKNSIGLDEPAVDWEEAVQLAGKYMINNHGIKERYITAMINAVKSIGPYMVVAPGIAIAHARPEDGAKKICISIVRLKNPVKFGSKNNDPVDLIFGLAAKDHDSHIGVLRGLARLLQNKGAIEEIRRADNTNEVYSLIQALDV